MPKSVFTEDYKLFRGLLLKARRDAGMNQTELAKRLRKPQSYVSKYESGERRLDIVEFMAICRALKVNLRNLIGKLESKTRKSSS